MKVKIIIFLALNFFVIISDNFCQPSVLSNELLLTSTWDIYSENYLSTKAAGKGYTGIASRNDLSGIVINPASLTQNSKYQAHVEYVYKSNVPWLEKIASNLVLKELHPVVFAGMSYKLNDYLIIGATYQTNKSFKFDLGKIEVTTANDPDGTGEFYDAYENVSISSAAIPFVYNYKNIFRAGVNLKYYFFSVKKNFGSFNGEGSFQKFIPDIGIIYSPVKNFSLGVTFTPESKKNFEEDFSSPDTSFVNKYPQPNIFPMKIKGGIEYSFPKTPLALSAEVNYVNTSVEENLKNRFDYHFGIEYTVNKNFNIRGGFFTLIDFRKEGPEYIDPVGELTQNFGTIGATYTADKFNLSLSVMDSHIFSSGVIKQTIINTGVGYNF